MRLRILLNASLLLLLVSVTVFAQKPELVVQTGHSSLVGSVAFSPDGKTLASSSHDHTIKLWDVSTGTELRSLMGHSDSVNSVAFSPDGNTLASGSSDNTISLWDVGTGAELRRLEGHSEPINSVAFSTDGKILASGSIDFTVKLWRVSTGVELRTLKGDSGVLSIAFSADGKILVSGNRDKPIKLWDVSTGVELRSLEGHSGFVPSVAVDSVAFSPDGKILVSGSRDNTVSLWDVPTGTELRSLKGHGVISVAFCADGKTIASGNDDGTVQLWDLTTGTELRTFKGHSDYVHSVAFSPDGKTLASGGGQDQTVKLWDVSTGTELQTLKAHAWPVYSVAFSTDGKTLASGSWAVKLWDVSTGTELHTLKAHGWPVYSVAFSTDGKTLASGSDHIKLWDVSTGIELRTLEGWSVGSVAFSTDGKTVASCSAGDTVNLWDVSTGAELRTLKGHSGIVFSVAFSPDGKTLASASDDGTIKLWDVSTGTEFRSLKAGTEFSIFKGHSTVFSPDGKILASVSDDETIKLWEVATGAELRTLEAHINSVNSVDFSPDGKTLASGSADGSVKLWDIAKGKELGTPLSGHSNLVSSVEFSPNNKCLVSGSADGGLKVWEISSGKELASLIALDEHDWMVVTPEGLFDGSPSAWKQILWRFNNNTFDHAPVEAFYNEFYHPGLLSDIMSGKRPVAPKDISQKDRRQIPVTLKTTEKIEPNVAIKSSAVTMQVEVEEAPAGPDVSDKNKLLPPSGARDVRLFRNGSLVKLWKGDIFTLSEKDGCALQSQTTPQSARRSICTATVPIIAGENHFTAYAFNNDNVKSLDADMTPIKGDESLKRPATLYVLAIGVGQNSNPNFKLNYAVQDAQDFAEQVKAQQQRIGHYAETKITALPDDKATKENILAELGRLAGLVHPEDGLIIYFSGHGTAQEKHFYMLPYDIGYMGPRTKAAIEQGNNLAEILNHSVSDEDLEKVLRTADAGQIVLVIDACNSGQALNADDPRRGPMNSTGLAQLAYEKGMYILTASQDFELAYESDALQHSYLTYALVEEGLKAKTNDADTNEDGQVDLREWFDYATQEVPRLREQKIEQSAKRQGTRRLRGRARAKQLEEVVITGRAKVQTPRAFYRREPDARPLVVAKVGATK
jgi:WD40 repeat protein/uncharacterized caspase-like protein